MNYLHWVGQELKFVFQWKIQTTQPTPKVSNTSLIEIESQPNPNCQSTQG